MLTYSPSKAAAAAFAPGGPVHRAHHEINGQPATDRPAQAQYASAVQDMLARSHVTAEGGLVTAIQGSTGIGKTLGYLVPALLEIHERHRAHRAMVSTYRLDLQQQILTHDAPVAIRAVEIMTGWRPQIALLRGRANFIARSRAVEIRDALADAGDSTALYDRLLDWLDRELHDPNGAGDFTSWQAYAQDLALPPINPLDIALTPTCPAPDQLCYDRQRPATADADLIVTNHAMLLLHCRRWMRLIERRPDSPTLLDEDDHSNRPIEVIIADEADQLPAAAESISLNRTTLNEIRRTLAAAADADLDPAILEHADTALDGVRDWFLSLLDQQHVEPARAFSRSGKSGGVLPLTGSPEIVAGTTRATLTLSAALRRVADAAGDAAAPLRMEINRITGEMERFLNVLKHNHKTSSTSAITPYVTWSPTRAYPAIATRSHSPGRVISRLWRRPNDARRADGHTAAYARAVILTSATLGVPAEERERRFRDLRSQLGLFDPHDGDATADQIDRPTYGLLFEPDRFGSLQIIQVHPDWPPPSLPSSDGLEDEAETEESTASFTNPAWVASTAHAIRVLAGAEAPRWLHPKRPPSIDHGHILVCTASYADAAALADRVRPTLGDRVILRERGTRLADAVAAFTATPNGILLTPGAWEGLSIPGNLVKHVVITRIPMAPPSAEHAAFLASFAPPESTQKPGSQLYAINRARALRHIVQAFGRGIRAPTDAVTVTITDPRFPLHDDIADALRCRSAASDHWRRFALCIPTRFRTGARAPWQRAGILAPPD